MSVCLRTICLAFAVGSAAAAFAGDAYYNIPVHELKLVEGRLPIRDSRPFYQLEWARTMANRVLLDGTGEAYFVAPPGGPWNSGAIDPGSKVVVRAAAGKELTGRLFVAKWDLSGMFTVRFAIPASKADPKAKEDFYRGKIAYYDDLLGRQIPGGAWFRHQIRLARMELNLPSGTEGTQPVVRWQPGRTDELTATYDLFTGGRAMSENLQLDRDHAPGPPQ